MECCTCRREKWKRRCMARPLRASSSRSASHSKAAAGLRLFSAAVCGGAKPSGFEVRDQAGWIIGDDAIDARPDEPSPITGLVGSPGHHLNAGVVRGGNSAPSNQPIGRADCVLGPFRRVLRYGAVVRAIGGSSRTLVEQKYAGDHERA
jgi:hypothetical protein